MPLIQNFELWTKLKAWKTLEITDSARASPAELSGKTLIETEMDCIGSGIAELNVGVTRSNEKAMRVMKQQINVSCHEFWDSESECRRVSKGTFWRLGRALGRCFEKFEFEKKMHLTLHWRFFTNIYTAQHSRKCLIFYLFFFSSESQWIIIWMESLIQITDSNFSRWILSMDYSELEKSSTKFNR